MNRDTCNLAIHWLCLQLHTCIVLLGRETKQHRPTDKEKIISQKSMHISNPSQNRGNNLQRSCVGIIDILNAENKWALFCYQVIATLTFKQ